MKIQKGRPLDLNTLKLLHIYQFCELYNFYEASKELLQISWFETVDCQHLTGYVNLFIRSEQNKKLPHFSATSLDMRDHSLNNIVTLN